MNSFPLRLVLAGWIMWSTACVATGSNVDANGSGGSGGYTTYGGGPTSSSTGTKGSTSATTGTHGSTSATSATSAMSSGPTTASVGSSTSAATSTVSSTSSGAPCQQGTRITYGALWNHPANHPAQHDDVIGATVTWDGTCPPQAPDSYAALSNGWQPSFMGTGGCVIGFDSECPSSPPPPCKTRITYGPSWQHAANHPAQYDDVDGHVTWSNNRLCVSVGNQSSANLSNGWQPTFEGSNACDMSFRYENCGGV